MASGKRDNASGRSNGTGIGNPLQGGLTGEARAGGIGGSLRDAGLYPDDDTDVVATPEALQARLEDARARHEARLARFNDELARLFSSGQVKPFFLIPDPCWNGEMGHFLMVRLGLLPYDAWNLAFLPTDAQMATVLGAPPHPNGNIAKFVTTAEAFVRGRQARLRVARAEAARTRDRAAYDAAKAEAVRDIQGLAALFSGLLTAAWRQYRTG